MRGRVAPPSAWILRWQDILRASAPSNPTLTFQPLAHLSACQVFREPNAMITKSNARVMSLQDGTSKMSKSAPNDLSRINLLDSEAEIRRKVRSP